MSQQPPPESSGGGYYRSQYPQQESQYPQPPQDPTQQQAPYPAQYPQPPQYQQPPPPGGAYPPPPQQPPPGTPPPFGYQAPPGMPGQPTPPKKSRRLLVILGAIGGLVVLGIAGAVISNLRSDAAIERETPDVGECIDEASLTAPETNVVDCGSAEAAWEVIGESGSMTGSQFDTTPGEEICTDFPETEYILWVGEDSTDGSGDGQVVCMVSVGSE